MVREREAPAHNESVAPGGKVLDLLLCRPLDDDGIGGYDA